MNGVSTIITAAAMPTVMKATVVPEIGRRLTNLRM